MKEYIFILGRDRDLGLLELVSYFKRKNISFGIKKRFEEAVLAAVDSFDLNKAISELGGTVKIAEVRENLDDIYLGNENKIMYGISYVNCNPEPLMHKLKKAFRSQRIKASYKRNESNIIPPSKSLNLDLELVYFNKIAGKVVAVSNPRKYQERDEKRPRFDPLKVTSIRLAKMLINLSQAKYEVLDPFCGNGTILQEALLMGLKVIGLDKDVRDAEENLKWLGKSGYKLISGDAGKLSNHIREAECLVTEPYMGPYLKKLPTKEEAVKIIFELKNLYFRVLKEAHGIVKNKIVIMVPDVRTHDGGIRFGFEEIIKKTGFRVYSPVGKISVPVPYFDKKDRLQRYIYILEKG
ncbi:hypothetical protein HYT58_01675 [Candidatus Woesearchaeota archaeon]|nr:hypothetical protein [Candidatus Woesearchaeota archaeon]